MLMEPLLSGGYRIEIYAEWVDGACRSGKTTACLKEVKVPGWTDPEDRWQRN
jgi:hypothetical protein